MNFQSPGTPTVLLSGASGMLGSAIGKALSLQGIGLLRLVRRSPVGSGDLQWNPSPGGSISQPERLEGISAAVHLSGANVASHRWTPSFKQEITQSRLASTRILAESLARMKQPPQVMVMASATGFYGNRGEEILDENSPAGSGFFPGLCTAWEAASTPAKDAGIRVVHLRLGVVIGPGEGAMARLIPIFRMGLGGPLGNGRQWMSWISQTDAVAATLFSLENPSLAGPVNAVSPEPVTNAAFTRELGKAVNRPAIIPAPAFALHLAFGEMADAALLASARVLPMRLLAAGFRFQHPSLADAFATALAK